MDKKADKKTAKNERINNILFFAVILSLFLTQHFIVGIISTDGDSMLPTVDRDVLLVARIGYKLNHEDIIICKNDKYLLCKRIIGMPGDKLFIEQDGTITINGEKYEDKYKNIDDDYKENPKNVYVGKEIILKDDEYFVMGDNRKVSADSRYFGPITGSEIKGKVIKIF